MPPDRLGWWSRRRVRTLARRLRAAAPGGRAVVEHVGNAAFRVVAVATDGTFLDVVVHGPGEAEEVVRLAGLSRVDPTEVGASLRTGPRDWQAMSGPRRWAGR